MSDIILKQESYKVIGVCMEIHRELGMGFKEAVYKEALEIEFLDKAIPFERERCFEIEYKGKVLRQHYRADFIFTQ